jgi:hypothetical protein
MDYALQSDSYLIKKIRAGDASRDKRYTSRRRIATIIKSTKNTKRLSKETPPPKTPKNLVFA